MIRVKSTPFWEFVKRTQEEVRSWPAYKKAGIALERSTDMKNPKFDWWDQIFVHWSATHYNWKERGHYHAVYTGDGAENILTPFDQVLHEHTYARNHKAVAVACACMGGKGFEEFPPTEKQVNSMCQGLAKLAIQKGWIPDEVYLKKRIMTHAEAAALRDFDLDLVKKYGGREDGVCNEHGLPHNNYGPSSWHDGWPGGTVERWDFWYLKPGDNPGSGGFLIRKKVVEYMKQLLKKG
jgi:hypothetical protein